MRTTSIPTEPTPNAVHQALLLSKDQPFGPLRLAESADAPVVQALSRGVAQRRSAAHLLFTTGLGLTDRSVPARLPAVLTPTLRVLERLKAMGVDLPDYVVYQATDFIVGVNGLRPERASANAMAMRDYLRRYVDGVHPEVAQHVHLRFGAEALAGDGVLERHVSDLRERLATDAQLAPLMAQLSEYRSNGGRNEGSELPYAAANALYNGAHAADYPFADLVQPQTEAILAVGGKREGPFFQLTGRLHTGRGPRPIGLIQQAGSQPTYYPSATGDLIDPHECDDERVQTMPHAVRQDFEVLRAAGATPERLRQLLLGAA